MRIFAGGFTLIELLTAIVIISILILPVALVLLEYARSIGDVDSLSICRYIAQKEFAVVNNTPFGSLDTRTYNNYDFYKYDLLRNVNYVSGSDNYLKSVALIVYPHGKTAADAVVSFITYAIGGNIVFGTGTAGENAPGIENSYFETGTPLRIEKDVIYGIPFRNIRPNANLTMVGVKMTCSRPRNIVVIDLDGSARLNKSYHLSSTEELVELDSNFFLQPNKYYPPEVGEGNGGAFYFQGGPDSAYVVTVKYVFYDGSESAPMSYSYTPL